MKKALTSVASLYMGMLPLFGAMQSGDIHRRRLVAMGVNCATWSKRME